MTSETYDQHADGIAMDLSDAIEMRDLGLAARRAHALSTRLVSTGDKGIQTETLRDLIDKLRRMLDAFSR